ncbi:hypothetical protein ABT167_38520 [Streptomyces sp. NPDC001792]
MSSELVQIPGVVHAFDVVFPNTSIAELGLATQVRALRDGLAEG